MLSWLDVCAGKENSERRNPSEDVCFTPFAGTFIFGTVEMLTRNGFQSAINKIFW
jgi:hypothetical protein